MPPLARFRAVHRSSLAWPPRVARATSATAASLRSRGRATVDAPARTARSASSPDAGSAGRSATISARGSPSSRGARYASHRRDGPSAQWASSTAISEEPAGREVGGEPVEAVEDGEGRVVGRRLPGRAREQCARRRRRSGQELIALVILHARQPALEELAHHPEREARLELRPARAQHLTAQAVRSSARRVEQRRLADPRPALDDEDAASISSASIAASSRSRSSSSTIPL